jgi:hypothetical protein
VDFNPMTIDYGIVVGGPSLLIYEKGVCKGSFGPYRAGDRVGVVVIKGVLTYIHNKKYMKESLLSASPTPLRIVAAFQGKGAKATALTHIKETSDFQQQRIPIEFSGEDRNSAIRGAYSQYGRPFTIEIRRAPAKGYFSWGYSNSSDAPKTEEEKHLKTNRNRLQAVECEKWVLQSATKVINTHKLCWDWWVEKLGERGFGSNRQVGLFEAIEEELDESGRQRKTQDGAGLPPLDRMGLRASPILITLSPAQLITNERLGTQLTCSNQHLSSFKHLSHGEIVSDLSLPSVLIPHFESEWKEWLEVTIPKEVSRWEVYEVEAEQIVNTFPSSFVEIGDIWLTDQLFKNEGSSESTDFKTVISKNDRLEFIHRELNVIPNCIANLIEAEGSRASNSDRNHAAWASDVSQVKAKKQQVDEEREKTEGDLEYFECIGHATLFLGGEHKGEEPSNYSENPEPTLLAFLKDVVKNNIHYRESNGLNVGAVGTIENNIQTDKKAKMKQERLLRDASQKLESSIEQEEEDKTLLKESSAKLETMNGEERDLQFALGKLTEETSAQEKNLKEKNDEYKANVAELKQKNIDDLTCGCLYKYALTSPQLCSTWASPDALPRRSHALRMTVTTRILRHI